MENAVSQTEEKAVAEISDEELAQLVAQNSKLQEQEMADGGVQPDYIVLAKPATKALKKSEKELYIPELHIDDFFIQKDKKVLGDRLVVVPLMFMTVYNEKDGTGRDAKFLGKWTQEQATQFPLLEGSYFDRVLPNGHVLSASKWVVVEVLDADFINDGKDVKINGHKDIKLAVIAYKSTGSRIWKAFRDDVRKRSGASATLVYTLFSDTYENDKGDWTDINFAYTANLLEKSKTEAFYCLKKSNELREAYSKSLLIGKHDIEALTAPRAQAQIEDASSVEDSDDSEEMGF